MFTHYTVIAVRRYLVRRAIALGTIIVMFGIWCEGRSVFHFRRSVIRNNKGRSLFMRDRRSLSVQSSHFEMVEMDKTVSGKRGWVTRALTQHTRWEIALLDIKDS
ncbi:hypothetical protein QUA35_18560 [Microcoleus sp. N9_B2]|uniref:hypothetical protein n=1 Tax=unclassified Microcoleus TaxID=2642155 RepID=UPI002FD79E42